MKCLLLRSYSKWKCKMSLNCSIEHKLQISWKSLYRLWNCSMHKYRTEGRRVAFRQVRRRDANSPKRKQGTIRNRRMQGSILTRFHPACVSTGHVVVPYFGSISHEASRHRSILPHHLLRFCSRWTWTAVCLITAPSQARSLCGSIFLLPEDINAKIQHWTAEKRTFPAESDFDNPRSELGKT